MQITRRNTILAGGMILGGTALGITQIDTASANVSGELDVPDVETHTNGESIDAITISVDTNYVYDSSHGADSLTLELLIGDSESTMQPIDDIVNTDIPDADAGTETLSGSLAGTYHFSLSSFEPVDSLPRETTVWIGVDMRLEREGETIAEEHITDHATVTVDGEEMNASVSLGASGEITVET